MPSKRAKSTVPGGRAPLVGILMGSDSDLPTMQEAGKLLEEFGVPHELRICSAHRTPDRLTRYAGEAEGRGIRVLIAGAGGAAHLAGVLAAHLTLPVIGVPMDSGPLSGLDALLSTVQMPGGVPVASVAIGRAGARNAALLAIQILALSDARLKRKLADYRARMAAEVDAKDRQIQPEPF
ncbi:MAG: 5-(carboxyamino)imidazole ribonucleotide mutase [candidate division NC10 bacterium RIFCSPLOWO2_12_FULL_66_18]|nr:MAG: 5-(carboxyamino)imidazole ribonucleotide mutase [candidate division NC10 bacterium RIFCSPLOWO2_02_FULL_66_22]OGC01978.1 MAG: 5-(carboxyamino)imidazole ribonucleotide mutase [candidate division NC10 bacterium RIFCSPLOWO2_12_FULL_66_18]